jgi:hypothetical protein
MSGRRFLLALVLAAAGGAALGCGFGRADDSGKPIPGQYWGWACPDGGKASADGGCFAADAGAGDAGVAGRRDAAGDSAGRD